MYSGWVFSAMTWHIFLVTKNGDIADRWCNLKRQRHKLRCISVWCIGVWMNTKTDCMKPRHINLSLSIKDEWAKDWIIWWVPKISRCVILFLVFPMTVLWENCIHPYQKHFLYVSSHTSTIHTTITSYAEKSGIAT